MDQSLLVASGRQLANLLATDNVPPRAAVWVHSGDTDTWKLWIVPHKSIGDEREFYRRISGLISKNRGSLLGLDAGDVQMIKKDHPAMIALSKMFHVTSGDVYISNNMLNGFYVPDGIILVLDY